ncbi:MAG: M3 family oligoendopeptidase, partial [Acidimicrobiales bacterium]
MATTDALESPPTGAEDVAWDIASLIDGEGAEGVDRALDAALAAAQSLTADTRGRLAGLDAGELAAVLDRLDALSQDAGRAATYAHLDFAVDTSDPARGALVQRVSERMAKLGAELVWFELEWAALEDGLADELLAADDVARYRHYLEKARARRPHQLSEPEEQVLASTAPTGRSAWVRLFDEQTSAIRVDLDGEDVALEVALSRLGSPDRDVRRTAADAVTAALQPGLR